MESNEIITTAVEEVVEATEELATACADNFGKGIAVGATAAMVGVIAYNYVVKPLAKKIKEKAQQRKAEKEACDLADCDYSDDVIIETEE